MHTALERGMRIGCTTIQVFTKNNARWEGKPYSAAERAAYAAAAARSAIEPVVAHAAYLINLCAVNAETLRKSREAFIDELQRCEQLGLYGLIVHPGAHTGAGEREGIRRIAESLNTCHAKTGSFRTRSILETTAGQGTAIGHRFEQLREVIDLVEQQERLAVCLDTCHVFAAGYDISTEQGWEATLRSFDAIVGLKRLAAIHVNDSRRELGSRVDRHDHIGKGRIGLTGFRLLMNDPRLSDIPKLLETEKSDDMHEDVENMNLLRSLVA
jgi:deoxyribonuclease-4